MDDVLKQAKLNQQNALDDSLRQKRAQRNIASTTISGQETKIQNYTLDLDEVETCISSLDSEETAMLVVHKSYEENKINKDDLLKGDRIDKEVQELKTKLEVNVFNQISDVNFAKEIGKQVKEKIEEKIEKCEETISACNLEITMIDISIQSLQNQISML